MNIRTEYAERLPKKQLWHTCTNLLVHLRIANYKEASDPSADKKWKQRIADYEKATGDKVEIEEVEEGEPIRGYIRPESTAPSRRAPYYLNKAQEAFVLCVAQAGYDLSQNLNRAPVNAKLIGTMRSTLKEFELNYSKFDKILRGVIDDIEVSADRYAEVKPKQRLQRVKNGVDRLFKKDIVKEPSTCQCTGRTCYTRHVACCKQQRNQRQSAI